MEWLKEILEEIEKLRRVSSVSVDIQLSLYDLIVAIENETSSGIQILESKVREHHAFEVNSTTHMKEIQKIDNQIRELEPILEDRQSTLRSLNELFEEHKSSQEEWEDENEKFKSRIIEVKSEREKLQESSEKLRNSMVNDKKIAEEGYKRALDKMKNITKYFPVMNYMITTTLENIPEAELMIIIGSNQPIEDSEIKSKVRTVAPVQVLRHLNKLQGDGLIKRDGDKWSLEEEFYNKLLNQM